MSESSIGLRDWGWRNGVCSGRGWEEAPCVAVPLDRVHWLRQEQLLKSHLPRREPETAKE